MHLRHVFIVLLAAVVGLWSSNWLPVTSQSSWVDSITGSMKFQNRCLIYCSNPSVHQSAIERWITLHEGTYRPDWRFLNETKRTVLGKVISWGCRLSPEIYQLHVGELNTHFVLSASDAEIGEFVRMMRTPKRPAQERAVEGAF